MSKVTSLQNLSGKQACSGRLDRALLVARRLAEGWPYEVAVKVRDLGGEGLTRRLLRTRARAPLSPARRKVTNLIGGKEPGNG